MESTVVSDALSLGCGSFMSIHSVWSKFFDLQAFTTTNLLTLIQLLFTLVGFIFTIRTLRNGTESLWLSNTNAQVQLMNNIATQGRQLQLRWLDLHANTDPNPTSRDALTGVILSFYSSYFEMAMIAKLSGRAIDLFKSDIGKFLEWDQVRNRWNEQKEGFSAEFRDFVDNIPTKRGDE